MELRETKFENKLKELIKLRNFRKTILGTLGVQAMPERYSLAKDAKKAMMLFAGRLERIESFIQEIHEQMKDIVRQQQLQQQQMKNVVQQQQLQQQQMKDIVLQQQLQQQQIRDIVQQEQVEHHQQNQEDEEQHSLPGANGGKTIIKALLPYFPSDGVEWKIENLSRSSSSCSPIEGPHYFCVDALINVWLRFCVNKEKQLCFSLMVERECGAEEVVLKTCAVLRKQPGQAVSLWSARFRLEGSKEENKFLIPLVLVDKKGNPVTVDALRKIGYVDPNTDTLKLNWNIRIC